jgi:putative copper export protein
MRSVRRFLVVAGTIVALTAALSVFVPSVLGSTTHTLTIVKNCSGTMTGKVGGYCTVTASNVAAIPKGSKVSYYGPVVSSSVFLSSTAIISHGAANTATGYCMVDLHTGVGMCTFWKGTGTLAGFHAIIHGSSESPTAYHWDGTYYFSGH